MNTYNIGLFSHMRYKYYIFTFAFDLHAYEQMKCIYELLFIFL